MTSNRTLILSIAFVLALAAFAAAMLWDPDPVASGSVRVVPASEVEWGALNPLRGDKSPRAGTLWGTRTRPGPSGFLVKFVDGFSSPPHIHPVTYRGMVISGLVHNDVPDAEETWLPAGSFWTQPAGEVHITAAKGTDNVAYIEIEEGPYLVHPAKDAFERPEVPVKLGAADMEWTSPPGMPASADGPRVAALAGNPRDAELRRTLVELPGGFDGSIRSNGSPLHAVVIQGRLDHQVRGETGREVLQPGSYFGSEGAVAHHVSCGEREASLLYVRTKGAFDVVPAQPRD